MQGNSSLLNTHENCKNDAQNFINKHLMIHTNNIFLVLIIIYYVNTVW